MASNPSLLVISTLKPPPRRSRIPQRGSVGIVQVLSTLKPSNPKIANPTPRQRVDPSSPFYPQASTPKIANPTPRQRGDPSSPFYPQASTPKIANPTPRQRGDPSSPFYPQAIKPQDRESHSAAACGSFKSFLLRASLPSARFERGGE